MKEDTSTEKKNSTKHLKFLFIVGAILLAAFLFFAVNSCFLGRDNLALNKPGSGVAPGVNKVNNNGAMVPKPLNTANKDSNSYARETLFYLSQSDYENALKTIEKGCSKDPQNPALLELKGRIAYQQGRLKEASDILEGIIRTNPDFAQAYNTLALVSIENEKPEEGLPLVETAINISPADVSFKVTRAKILEHMNKPDEADREYQKITVENPENLLVYKDWALLHYDLGNRKKAVEILDKSISRCKNDEDLIEMYTVKMDSTIDLLDDIEDDNTDEACKTVYYVVDSVEKDVAKLKEADLLRPVVYSTLNNMYHTVALHCSEKREEFNKKAMKYARKYIEEAPPPTTPDKFHIMGDAYQYLGEYDKAMECYNKAMVGEYAQSVYINVAEVHIARKNYPAAREYLNKIINLKNDHYDKKEARIILKRIKDKK